MRAKLPSVSASSADPWVQQLAGRLGRRSEDPLGDALDFASRVSAAYTSTTDPVTAAADMVELSTLLEQGGSADRPEAGGAAGGDPFGSRHRLAVGEGGNDSSSFRLRRYGTERIALTTLLPVLESFGLVVVESIPHRVAPGAGGTETFIDDIGVTTEAPWGPETLRFVSAVHGPRLVEALEAIARGDAEVDALNRLVTLAGLEWRQVTVLRAYARVLAADPLPRTLPRPRPRRAH